MKKGKHFLPLFLAATLFAGAFSAHVPAEDYGEDEQYEEDGQYGEDSYEDPAEEDGESSEVVDAYYDEIQSNEVSGWPQGDAVQAEAAIVMDAETGAVLYAKDIGEVLYPASITKIMTALLALENGNLDDVVKFSEYAVYSIEYGSSHLGLTEGEELTLEQCLYGILLASANEISNAVAEHIGGDVTHFVEMMNERAAELGCVHTHFVNPHGLHDEDHYVCAWDMALIMREALRNPKFREIIGTVEYFYPETNLVDEKRYFMNHHKMISEEGELYDGCIGGKNGFTDEAWNTLVTAAERDGQELICVVLKVPGQYESYEETRVLLDYGFDHFSNVQVSNAASPDMKIVGITDEAELSRIQKADILKPPFSMVGTTMVTLPEGVQESSLVKTMDFASGTLSYSYAGQTLGSVPFTYTGEWETEALTETETSAESETAAAEASKPGSFLQSAKAFFGRVADGAANAYETMDSFIEENTVTAAILGALLLLLFVPLLFLALIRQRRYRRIMKLRQKEMEERQRLEEEIERKSAAQIEAELRAEALQIQLEEEKLRQTAGDRQKPKMPPEEANAADDTAKGIPVTGQEGAAEEGALTDGEGAAEEDAAADEESAAGEDAAEEEEYIEVPIEEQDNEIKEK